MTEAGIRGSRMETENTESQLTYKHTDARAHTHTTQLTDSPPSPKELPEHLKWAICITLSSGAKASYPVTNISTSQCQRRKLCTSQSKDSIYPQ